MSKSENFVESNRRICAKRLLGWTCGWSGAKALLCIWVCLLFALGGVDAKSKDNSGKTYETPQVGSTKRIPAKHDVTRIGKRGIGSGLNLYSIDRERALGRELATEADSGMRFVTDSTVTKYVTRIVQNLVVHSDAKVPFVVKVVDDGEVNAFSFPGGFLYVNSGLILRCESEAELVGILSHEIAHVAARHATKALTRRELFSLATLPLAFTGGGVAVAIGSATRIATPIAFMKFSRNAEREADLLGIEYVYAAGYDPTEFVHFFERTRAALRQRKDRSLIVRLFDTHPMTEDRIRRAQLEIANALPPQSQYVVTTSEFDQVRKRLLDMSRVNETSYSPKLRRRHPE